MNARRSIAAAAVVLAAPALSSCGFDAPTEQIYNPTVGVFDKSGSVELLNVLVVADAAGSGTVIATLVNSDLVNDDALTGVTGSGESAEATFEVAGSVDILAGGLVNLAEEGPISVDPADELVPGLLIPVTFEFERSAQVTLQVPIVEQTDEGPYADVPVS